MSQIRKGWQVLLVLLAIFVAAAAIFLFRSKHPSGRVTGTSNQSGLNPAYLSLLQSNQLLAKVGGVELRSRDLRDVLQLEFHGETLHSSFSPQDLSLRIAAGLDRLIEDELLAQGATKEGFKTLLRGPQGRQDLA